MKAKIGSLHWKPRLSRQGLLLLLLAASLALFMLSAQSPDRSFDQLRQQLEQIKSRPSGNIEALPDTPAYQPESYTASALRSPFQLNFNTGHTTQQKGSQPQPDLLRPKTELEQIPLESLTMVGTFQFIDEQTASALIQDTSGNVYKVRIGAHLGPDFGKILSITQQSILLEEVVQDELGGWVKRPRQLKLMGSE